MKEISWLHLCIVEGKVICSRAVEDLNKKGFVLYELVSVSTNSQVLVCEVMSGELPLTYLPFYSLLIVHFLSPFSLLLLPSPSIFTGSISSDCDRYGHSHVV
jgi:hypothetical protein